VARTIHVLTIVNATFQILKYCLNTLYLTLHLVLVKRGSLSRWKVGPCHSEKWDTVTVKSGSLSRHGASSNCGLMNGLQIWRVAANILNKQSRTADNEWSSSLGVGRGANNSSPYKLNHVTKRLHEPRIRTGVDERIILKRILKHCDGEALTRYKWRALVNASINLRVPWNAFNFLSIWRPVRFSGRTLLHGVS
jgi:hypothetical protein